jgi:hypothetical protein
MSSLFFRKVIDSDFNTIAELQSLLWGGKLSYRLEMIKWKCGELNSSEFKGAVAVENDKIVGYRGIVNSQVKIQGKVYNLLHYTDAIVHPDYRGRQILQHLNNFIAETYKNCFDFTFIFFPNQVSGHIYRKQQNNDFLSIIFFYRKFLLPIPTRVDFKIHEEIDRIAEKILIVNEGSSDIMSFDFSLSYLNWKLREPGRTFVLIESNSNSETVVLIEKKPKRIEILFLNYTRLNECLEVVSKYAMNNFVFVIDLPLACSQEKKISPFLVQNRFRKWAFMNRFKTNFYSQKPILSKKINEHLTEGEEKLFLDVYNWNYHHITYV